MYLAEQRDRTQTDSLLSYHTFNFGPYIAESRRPFGAFYRLNDDTLLPGASLSLPAEQPTDAIVLPIVGGLEYRSEQASGFLEAGQAGIFSVPAGMNYAIHNPYETEPINFLQLWLAKPSAHSAPSFRITNFDLAIKNRLLPVAEMIDHEAVSRVHIGRYDGRQEGTYLVTVQTGVQGVFVFILQGAFEVANRLLHERDGLALRYHHDDVLEFEALSNDALLLLIELPLLS